MVWSTEAGRNGVKGWHLVLEDGREARGKGSGEAHLRPGKG